MKHQKVIDQKLCELINVSYKEIRKIQTSDTIDSLYWRSLYTWTSEQKQQFSEWLSQSKFLKEITTNQAFGLYKDKPERLIELIVREIGWRDEGLEVRPNKPGYLYVNDPKRMPVIWTRDEFYNCTYMDLSRFWCNTQYCLDKVKDEIHVYSRWFKDYILKKLKIEDVYEISSAEMYIVKIPMSHTYTEWILEHMKPWFLKETIQDAISEEQAIQWKKT